MTRAPIVIELAGRRYEVPAGERPTGETGWYADLDVELDGHPARVRVDIATLQVPQPTPLPHAGHVLGVPDDELLAALAAAGVARVKIMKGGSTLSLRVHLDGGTMALFKPQQVSPHASPRKELAAYELARATGLAAVPPTVLRRLSRDEIISVIPPEASFFGPRILAETQFDADGMTLGSLAAWIPGLTDSGLDSLQSIRTWSRWLSIGYEVPADHGFLMSQLSSLLLFDVLISNYDRFTGGGLPCSSDGTVLYAIDHSLGFDLDRHGSSHCWRYLKRCQKFSKRAIDALHRLGAVQPALGQLTNDERDAVVARRVAVLSHVDALIATHGEPAVLALP